MTRIALAVVGDVKMGRAVAALAPEDETMLFVRQKPNKKGGYGYLAHLPERARISAGEAWYGNTGSFILTRLAER